MIKICNNRKILKRWANTKGHPSEKYLVTCISCDSTFVVTKWSYNHGYGKFCSKQCRYKAQSGANNGNWKGRTITKNCQMCSRRFTTRHNNKFCSRQCSSAAQKGEKSIRWKGGRRKDCKGYICLYLPDYQHAPRNKQMFEHRYIMAQHLKRPLNAYEVVHHINGIKDDNRIENLQLTTKRLHPKCSPEEWLNWVNRYWQN